jgi:hypothetical protein
MLSPRVRFAAAVSFLVLVPFAREASAQKKKPPVTPPIVRPADRKPDPAPGKAGPPKGAEMTGATATMMPSISYGTPQPRTIADVAEFNAAFVPGAAGAGEKKGPRQLTTVVAGQNVSSKVLHLRGLDDIEQAELPDDAKRLLIMHVGKISAEQSDHYIVNPQLAEEWLKTHDVPDDIKPPEKKKEKKGCSTRHISMKCVSNETEQAIDKASEEWEKLREQAEQEWGNAAEKLSDAWKETRACFADKTLSLNEIPVQFSIAPSMSIPVDGPAFPGSSASGALSGSVSLGFPMKSDFSAQLDLFYIPCLPFAIRPKALSADGTMTVGETLTASMAATGQFARTFRIPPAGGPTIPIVMIPIVIAGVPVAELDVSAYIEGSVKVTGDGKAEAQFKVENTQTTQFDFSCDGGGCKSRSQAVAEPTTVSESAQLQGQVAVEPAVYTALQLNFNFNALSARAGPQPYLLATGAGCAAAAAQQSTDGSSKVGTNEVLTADLDWGVKFRAEALVGGQIVGNPFVKDLTGNRHIWFRDLVGGGSSALVAVVDTAAGVIAGTPAAYTVKMPSCYPFTSPIHYRVTWTGDAVAAPVKGCDWQKGICKSDPMRELEIKLTWATPGSYSLTVIPVGDDHGKQLRTFAPAPKPTAVVVTVVGGG